jgi:hypothetical protein
VTQQTNRVSEKVEALQVEWNSVDTRFKHMSEMAEMLRGAAVDAARMEATKLVKEQSQARTEDGKTIDQVAFMLNQVRTSHGKMIDTFAYFVKSR